MTVFSTAQMDTYQEAGYLIIRQAFSAQRTKALLEAVEHMVERGLNGEVQLNWIDQEQGLPERTGHMLHPDKYEPAFGLWLAEDLDPQLETLLQGKGRHSLFGMLAGGGGRAYHQTWHRDLGKPGHPEEAQFLHRFHGRSVQFNAPLVTDDHFLNIVPASHLRASTPAELAAAQAGEEADMPNALVVELEPGDIVYYNANLWHRGWNPTGQKRWSMHCAFWRAEEPVMKHEYGQKEALTTPDHLASMPPDAGKYIERYLAQYPEENPPDLRDL